MAVKLVATEILAVPANFPAQLAVPVNLEGVTANLEGVTANLEGLVANLVVLAANLVVLAENLPGTFLDLRRHCFSCS